MRKAVKAFQYGVIVNQSQRCARSAAGYTFSYIRQSLLLPVRLPLNVDIYRLHVSTLQSLPIFNELYNAHTRLSRHHQSFKDPISRTVIRKMVNFAEWENSQFSFERITKSNLDIRRVLLKEVETKSMDPHSSTAISQSRESFTLWIMRLD